MNCVLHVGYCQPDGYGQKKYKGRVVLAHRLAYALAHELDVFSMGGTILHTCDTPGCVEPTHLVLGTQLENILDMVQKDRQSSKLSASDVQYIRLNWVRGTRHRPGNTQALADMFQVHRKSIENAGTGKCRVGV
jgi:hypothetical protein